MTQRARGRGEKPDLTPKKYYAYDADGNRQREPIRLNMRNKARYEAMGWTFKAVHG